MSSTNSITEMINSIRQLTHIGICFYDLDNFYSYLDTGEREYSGHYCEYCRRIKLLSGGQKACDSCDKGEVVKLAAEYGKLFFYRCHAGLCELILPVFDNGTIKGIILLGQCKITGEELTFETMKSISQKGGNPDIFKKLYNELPECDKSSLLSCGKILQLFFEEKSLKANTFNAFGKNLSDITLPVTERIKNYIDFHYRESITSKTLSSLFYIEGSYLSRKFKQTYGLTPTEYITKVRIYDAKRLLSSTEISVSSIAINVGYQDPNYFYRVFEKTTGMRPTEYRFKMKNE